MILTQNLKTTTSALALTLALMSQTVTAMDTTQSAESIAHTSTFALPASNLTVRQYIPTFSDQNVTELKKEKSTFCDGKEYIFLNGSRTGQLTGFVLIEDTTVIPNTSKDFPDLNQMIELDLTNQCLNLSYTYKGTAGLRSYTFTLKTRIDEKNLEAIQYLAFENGQFHGFPALAYKVFPETLYFNQLHELAEGNALVLEGQNVRAVNPEIIKSNLPATFKQLGRSTLAFVGAAEEAGAKKIEGIKDSGNIKIQNYRYTPAGNMGTTFQFSVYFEDQHPSLPKGNKEILERIKKQDRIENVKSLYGNCHPDVIADDIANKINMIRLTQLSPLVTQVVNIENRMHQAFVQNDELVNQFLDLTRQQIQAEMFVAKQKLHFLEVTAPQMLEKNTSLKASDLFETMQVVANSVFFTKEIIEKKQLFEKHYPEVVERASTYKVNVDFAPRDLPPLLPIDLNQNTGDVTK